MKDIDVIVYNLKTKLFDLKEEIEQLQDLVKSEYVYIPTKTKSLSHNCRCIVRGKLPAMVHKSTLQNLRLDEVESWVSSKTLAKKIHNCLNS